MRRECSALIAGLAGRLASSFMYSSSPPSTAVVAAAAALQVSAARSPRLQSRQFSGKAPLARASQHQAMATYWRRLLHNAKAFGAQRPAAVLLGGAALSAGVWAAQAEWRRQQQRPVQAASGAAEPSPLPHAGSACAPVPKPDTDQDAPAAGLDDKRPAAGWQPHPPRFVLDAGAGMIPHPAKADRGGEDAYFVCPRGLCMGVADGVGGWAEVGVDPGLYSRELMAHAAAASPLTTPGPLAPQQLLEEAHRSTLARGSSTACILCLQDEQLHASNLGDSGFLVVRDGRLLFMSPQQQHEFNFPYQIGSPDSMSDTPKMAQRFSLPVRSGDVVVAATDGLFDNVYPDEAAALVWAAKERGEGAQAAAAALAQYARGRAGDPTHLSPFAYGAQQLGYRYYGGKLDDITVLVAYVAPAGPPADAPPADVPPASKL